MKIYKFIIFILTILVIIFIILKFNDGLIIKNCFVEEKKQEEKEILKKEVKKKESLLTPIEICADDDYKVYSFRSGLNIIDLNFDGVKDNVFVSHICGADYYDYHVVSDRDVYNFFIFNKNYYNDPGSWNIVTKENPNKKIDKFKRSFSVSELLGCNGGDVLRIVQTKSKETFLVLSHASDNKSDGCKISVVFDIYKLKKTGHIAGSDYIFSFVKNVVGESHGSGVGATADKDILGVIRKVLLETSF